MKTLWESVGKIQLWFVIENSFYDIVVYVSADN